MAPLSAALPERGNQHGPADDRWFMERTRRPGAVGTRSVRGLAVLALVVVVTSCGGGGGGAGAVGDRLPDVTITPLDGGDEVRLGDIDGPAVVNLWATWCVPCRKEIPDFQAVHEARGDEVHFIGINIGQGADEIGDYLTEVGATYDQYIDEEGFVQTGLEATSMPTTVVIDADGTIVTRHLGPMDQDALDEAIDIALAG